MSTTPKNWLQLFVDAMTEKDPYKRLAMVRELRDTPRPEAAPVRPGETPSAAIKPVVSNSSRPRLKSRSARAKSTSRRHR